MIRYLTAGESHGQKLTIIIDGIPAGLELKPVFIDRELEKRQPIIGRSERMKIEKDRVKITSGIRFGKTIGSPISIEIENRVFERQKEIWSDPLLPSVTIPRPGHADYAGWAKYEGMDIRNVIERASARETAARIVAGAIAKSFLGAFEIQTAYRVRSIGKIKDDGQFDWQKDLDRGPETPLCNDPEIERKWKEIIEDAKRNGDSIGGRFECRAKNVPIGLGTYTQWDRRLDGRIAMAVMAVPGIKGVSIGDGLDIERFTGDKFRDPIILEEDGSISRKSNHAGGLEGGVTNGEEIVVQAIMKPIPGVQIPTDSVDLDEMKKASSRHERADTCVVQAAAVICENMIALEIANAMIDRYGGDTIGIIEAALERDRLGQKSGWRPT